MPGSCRSFYRIMYMLSCTAVDKLWIPFSLLASNRSSVVADPVKQISMHRFLIALEISPCKGFIIRKALKFLCGEIILALPSFKPHSFIKSLPLGSNKEFKRSKTFALQKFTLSSKANRLVQQLSPRRHRPTQNDRLLHCLHLYQGIYCTKLNS